MPKANYCNECGVQITVKSGEQIQLTKVEQTLVNEQRRTAEQRTRFEQAIFRIQSYVTEQNLAAPVCFISYAWGVPEHERWVERSLATDLQKAGLVLLLDRWDNARIGASISRFISRIAEADKILVVGTPLYRDKYDNNNPFGGYVGAAEGDLIGKRMTGSEAQKESVLPVLLSGEEENALPPLLQGRVYADFCESSKYLSTMFDLVLSLYDVPVTHRAAADLRSSLRLM